MARTLVVAGERPMSITGRRVLTAKTLAVSAITLVLLVIAVAHRRHLDATHGRKRERGHPAAPFSW